MSAANALKLVIVTAGICVFGVDRASASLVTTEVETGFAGVSVINAYTWPSGSEQTVAGISRNFLLPKFDSTLGTLQTVTLYYTSSSVFNLTLTSQTDGFQIKGTLGVDQTLTDPNAVLLYDVTEGIHTPGSGFLTLNNGQTFVANSSRKGLPSPLSAISSTAITSLDEDLSVYQSVGGVGNFTSVYTSSQGFTGTTQNGNFQITGGSSDGAAMGVQYTYDPAAPVPEPATYTFVASSLLGLGFYARKRTRR